MKTAIPLKGSQDDVFSQIIILVKIVSLIKLGEDGNRSCPKPN